MTMILLESSLMIVFMLAFRKLCRNVLSPRIVYALWLFTAFRMLPVECLFGRDIHMLSLNAFSRLFGKIPFLRDIWFELSMLRIPWYLLVIWVLEVSPSFYMNTLSISNLKNFCMKTECRLRMKMFRLRCIMCRIFVPRACLR